MNSVPGQVPPPRDELRPRGTPRTSVVLRSHFQVINVIACDQVQKAELGVRQLHPILTDLPLGPLIGRTVPYRHKNDLMVKMVQAREQAKRGLTNSSPQHMMFHG